MVVVLSAAVGLAWNQDGQAAETVRFAQSSEEVERYDLLEVTVSVDLSIPKITSGSASGEFLGLPVR
ncbi:MAG TPA: hypothetical protein VMY69_04865 [Phycisphaerae bacterium]|nr:hypothetical protein [Phycisphaerae bacterium]